MPQAKNKDRSVVVLPLDHVEEIVGDMDLLMKAGIDVLSQKI